MDIFNKGCGMKKITLITLALTFLFFSGCKNTDFDKSIREDVLEKTDKWYEIDSTRDLYQTFEFNGDTLIKNIYNDRYFSELIDRKSFNLYYTSDSEFMVTEDGVNYTCEVSTANEDEFIVVSCKANEVGVSELLYCGWNSQDKANANMQ